VCVALSLTIIAKRMAKRNILVKNLATIETLGCTTILCSDKTGTLTMGQMVRSPYLVILLNLIDRCEKAVQNIAFLDGQYTIRDFSSESGPTPPVAMKPLLTISRLCNEARFDDTGLSLSIEDRTIKGDATDAAVLRFAESMSFPSIDFTSATVLSSYRKIFEIPFNSQNKWMLSAVEEVGVNEDPWIFVKGAPDVLFSNCTMVLQSDGTITPLNLAAQRQFHTSQEQWSREGQRVLALCRKSLPAVKIDPSKMSANDIEELMYLELRDLTLVGLIGIQDTPRYDVKDAMAVIRNAGIRVFMITGDFKLTAIAIARQVGLAFID
jgi:sodium/potassium-transporting ATPase subunit alpha